MWRSSLLEMTGDDNTNVQTVYILVFTAAFMARNTYIPVLLYSLYRYSMYDQTSTDQEGKFAKPARG